MKNILITGGSRGIGAAIAKALASKDYRVIINYNKSEKEAKEVLNYIKDRTVGYMVKADISKPEEVDAMFSEIECMVGPVDILVNNAGIAMYGLFQDASLEEIENLFKVNVGGLLNVTKRALPGMISMKSGKILNVSSIWGIVGASNESHYAATKAAIISYTKSLANELSYSGISVNCIAPGAILTEMCTDLGTCTLEEVRHDIPFGRLGTVEEVANLAKFIVSDENSYMTGQVISQNGGMVVY